MATLAYSGASNGSKQGSSVPNGAIRIRGVRLQDSRVLVLGGRSDTDGYPDPPCLRMDALGSRTIEWPVDAASHTLTIAVKQALNLSPRPRMVVKSNSAIGIPSDLESVAASSTGWVTLSINFTPTAEGVVRVVLENRYDGQPGAAPCLWDHFQDS